MSHIVELRQGADDVPYGLTPLEMVLASQSMDEMKKFMARRSRYIPLSKREIDLNQLHNMPNQYYSPQVDHTAPTVRLGVKNANLIHDRLRNGFNRWDEETRRSFSHAPSKHYVRQHPGKMAGHGPAKLAYLEALHRFEVDVRQGGGYTVHVKKVQLPSAKPSDGQAVFHRLKE